MNQQNFKLIFDLYERDYLDAEWALYPTTAYIRKNQELINDPIGWLKEQDEYLYI